MQMGIFFRTLLLMSLFFVVTTVDAQNKKTLRLFEDAKIYYRSQENSKALEKLDAAIDQKSDYLDAYLLKADIYNEMDSTEQQIDCLLKAIDISPSAYPRVHSILGNAYASIGCYEEAIDAFRQYLAVKPDGKLKEKVMARIDECVFAADLVKRKVPFSPENMGEAINSEMDEYWPSLTIDSKNFIFTRLVPIEGVTSVLLPRFQEDFYQSVYDSTSWTQAVPIESINTTKNEGAQSVSADGRMLFFTACNREDGYGGCDIYFSRRISGRWTEPINAGAPVNSTSWESQPSISANGEYLYFVSNRKGGKGGMDIWRCQIKGISITGRPAWGELENLGDSVNTSGNEMSPFIHADGRTLYFASDKWPGLGGTDLFMTRAKEDGGWRTPQNLGYPINTYGEEQGMIVDAMGTNAYYSSKRAGSQGVDIYKFKLFEDIRPNPVSYVKGEVVAENTGDLLRAKVELIDIEKNELVAQTESHLDKGEFLLCLPLGNEYAFNVSSDGYLFYSENFALKETREMSDPINLKVELEPIEIGNRTVLRNIFFETDSYQLKPESLAELTKLISFLHQNKTVGIELSGHTDSVGDEQYNQLLSENRAKAVYSYLIDEGIDAERLSYKGYGLSEPIADNETEEGRAQNRRTEFKITKDNF